eukprot:SAG31_NODE_667_length_12948_cov_70.090746_1_plen_165_part_00
MYFWARPKAPWETKEVVVPSGRKPPPRDNTGSAPPWERSEDLNITAAAKRPPNVAPFFTELTRHDQPDISGLSVKKNRKPPEPPRWARTSDNTYEIRTVSSSAVNSEELYRGERVTCAAAYLCSIKTRLLDHQPPPDQLRLQVRKRSKNPCRGPGLRGKTLLTR